MVTFLSSFSFFYFFLVQMLKNTLLGPDGVTCNFFSRSFLHFFRSNQDQVNISSLLLNRSLVVDVKGNSCWLKNILEIIQNCVFNFIVKSF